MNHERLAMLAALNGVKPALATKDLMPELAHVWFDGNTVSAFNDADMGIQVPFKSPFKGGIRGALLLGLLHNSRAPNIVFQETDEVDKIIMKAARAEARLAVLPPSAMLWKMPKISETVFDFEDDFIAALKAVLISVGNETSTPEMMGVTVSVGKKFINFYTTDSNTLAHARVALNAKAAPLLASSRFILPTAFCWQLLRLCPQGGWLDLQEDYVLAGNKDDAVLYARLVHQGDRSTDFAQIIKNHSDFQAGAEFPLPKRLDLVLDRCLIILDGKQDEPVQVDIKHGRMYFLGVAEGRGELNDIVMVPDDVPEMSFKISPYLIKRALGAVTHMAVSEKAVRLFGPDEETQFSYFAATRA